MDTFDVVVVGGGMAGTSIAYELAADRTVCLLEAETGLAQHTTGRSAATWVASYGPPVVRRLTAASRPFLDDPPLDVDGPVLEPLPCLYAGGPGSFDAVRELAEATGIAVLRPEEARAVNPVLRADWLEAAAYDETSMAVDVHGLHQGYVRGLRARGGVVRTGSRVLAASRTDGGWRVETAGEPVAAPLVVDAAGAWGDEVAGLFGAHPVGLRARRRTVFVSAPTADRSGPGFTIEVGQRWYFKPEGDALLCSPADQAEQPPGDPRPDELEIARALEEINEATTLGLKSVRTAWAGQRTFAPSGEPVARFDDDVEGFFWYVGQGGYGIQMAAGLAREAAALVRER
jgi:D-arginine dehydrogenase